MTENADSLFIGLIQMKVVSSKEENISKMEQMVKAAADKGAKMAVLPEMFNCPYDNSLFRSYAEIEGGFTYKKLSNSAKENNIYIVGGSIPEIDDANRVYNTCYIFDSKGNKIGKHRKMHLFDINVEGGQYFKESDALSAGNSMTVFDTPYGKMGAEICFDIRFPELSRLMVLKGAKVIFVPGAFNMTTGPAHWELLFRARSLDNQIYTVGAAPASNYEASYISYGNSLVADPWGKITGRLGQDEDILIQEIDMSKVEKIRGELPVLSGLRKDVYKIDYHSF